MAKRIIALASNGRQTRKLRTNASWTDPDKQNDFLAHLAMTCNVTESAASAGLTSRHVGYKLRMSDADFRARWDAAIDEGRQRLWGELLALASKAIAPLPVPSEGDADPPPPDPSLAIGLLKMHAGTKPVGAGWGRAPGAGKAPRRIPMSADELRALIFEKLSAKNRELGGNG